VRNSVATNLPQDANGEVNLTPMLDVVFILLIFFIVTASFIREVGIDVSPPDTHKKRENDDAGILINIDAANQIWIERRLIDPRALRASIKRLHAENPRAKVVIQADRRSSNKTLVRAMDASREAGVYNFLLAADQETRSPMGPKPMP
jgi:biopolymer transport protein ExbD